MKIRFIGDVHGKFGEYLYITDQCDRSIQVGDFGVGFAPVPDISFKHRFIRGNHDNPAEVSKYNWIPDGFSEGPMFFVGGGESIDQHRRTEGVDWWADEQLSQGRLYDILDRYEAKKPSILVCHECPSVVTERLFNGHIRDIKPSRTSQALGVFLESHAPDMVIFGHFHVARDQVINGVRFICLPELGYMDLDI
jgi:predicted phosphodiesterase